MQDEYTENRASYRLRVSIEGRGFGLASFSRFSEVPYRSIQDYVSGKSKPGFEQLAKFAAAGLDIGYILTGHPTGSLSHPSGSGMIEGAIAAQHDGVTATIYGRATLEKIVEPFADRALEHLELRDWIEAWNLADDWAKKYDGWDNSRRQKAAVFMAATHIAEGLIDRLRAQGWIANSVDN